MGLLEWSSARTRSKAMTRLTVSPTTPSVSARAFYYPTYFYGFRYAG